MCRFLIKLAIFLTPIAFVFAVPVTVLVLSREYVSMPASVTKQLEEPHTLYGKAFIDSDNVGRLYKKELVRRRDTHVMVLGSSRALEFRESFFKEPTHFTNAAFGAASMPKIEDFLRTLPEDSDIDVLILGLDPMFFKPGYDPHEETTTSLGRVSDFFSYQWKKIYWEIVSGRYTLPQLFRQSFAAPHVGLAAMVDGNGYRSDGSYRYGAMTREDRLTTLDNDIANSVLRLRADRGSFDYGTEISGDAFDSLERILATAQQRGIHVVAFVPPIAPALYDEVMSAEDVYKKAATDSTKKMQGSLARYGFKLFDFADASMLGGSPAEFVNDTHATDKLNLRMLLYMAARDTNLAQYVDVPETNDLIRSAQGDFLPL